jgi:glycosyltransferase involved in cell wall biosynthesis
MSLTTKNPGSRISVIIPLYNGAQYIAQSIVSAVDQTLLPHEIIVVDDGSSDDGAEIVRNLSQKSIIRLLRKENGGQASARNLGIASSEGDLIALLDQDDIWYPNHLAELAKPFLEPRVKELGWVYSDLDEIDESGKVIARSAISTSTIINPKRDLITCLRQDMFVLPSASLMSRKAFDAVGGFDERLAGYEDDDLFLRMFRDGFDNEFIKEALSQWRIYRGSSSYSPRMARSRRIYAEKLITQYPDDPGAGRYYTRDLLVPRFFGQMAVEYRNALVSQEGNAIVTARSDLNFIKSCAPAIKATAETELTISVVIPLHNGVSYIEKALRSVTAQNLQPAEIVVVDDGSTDNGLAIVQQFARKYPLKILSQENKGQSSARNLGVAHSGGDLIAFLDQDDIWFSDHLSELVKPFLEPRSKQLGWVYSNLEEIDEKGCTITNRFLSSFGIQHPKRDLIACLASDMFILPSASLISREAFDAVGGFDERLSGYEDDDLFLRLFRAGFDNVYVDKELSQWRIYPSSSSYSPRMARSRCIYARKLIDQFPADPKRSRYYVRDLIVPRFLPIMLNEYRLALRSRRTDSIHMYAEYLRSIKPHISFGKRVSVGVILALGPLGNIAFMIKPILRPIYVLLSR